MLQWVVEGELERHWGPSLVEGKLSWDMVSPSYSLAGWGAQWRKKKCTLLWVLLFDLSAVIEHSKNFWSWWCFQKNEACEVNEKDQREDNRKKHWAPAMAMTPLKSTMGHGRSRVLHPWGSMFILFCSSFQHRDLSPWAMALTQIHFFL